MTALNTRNKSASNNFMLRKAKENSEYFTVLVRYTFKPMCLRLFGIKYENNNQQMNLICTLVV